MDFFRIPWHSEKNHDKHEKLHAPVGKFLRHAIFGMNDGLVSTLALMAGLVGAAMGKEVIVIAGLAEMMAGAISMSLGTYISTKSQLEFYGEEIEKEKKDLECSPQMEKEHVREIYRRKGFVGKELDNVVKRLTSNKKRWLNILVNEELGLNNSKMENAVIAGVVMFFAFIFGAFVPLSSFVFVPMGFALKTAMASSLLLLFFVGAGKTHFTGRSWIKSGFEMVLVGALATGVAYYLGEFVSRYVSVLI